MDETKVSMIIWVRGELVEEFARVHNSRVPSLVHLLEDVEGAVQVNWIVADVGVLSPGFAVGNNSPFSCLLVLFDAKERCVGNGLSARLRFSHRA